MANISAADFFPEVENPEGTYAINGRCLLITRDNRRVVLVSGMPIAQYALADRMSEAHAMVSLVELGWADQNDVAKAFGCSADAPTASTTLHRRRLGCAGPAQRLSARMGSSGSLAPQPHPAPEVSGLLAS
jgi:hypothetical protein